MATITAAQGGGATATLGGGAWVAGGVASIDWSNVDAKRGYENNYHQFGTGPSQYDPYYEGGPPVASTDPMDGYPSSPAQVNYVQLGRGFHGLNPNTGEIRDLGSQYSYVYFDPEMPASGPQSFTYPADGGLVIHRSAVIDHNNVKTMFNSGGRDYPIDPNRVYFRFYQYNSGGGDWKYGSFPRQHPGYPGTNIQWRDSGTGW